MANRINNQDQYEALRNQGKSKETAAKIVNSPDTGPAKQYEKRTKQELYTLAKEREIRGRSKMNKEELITALRKDQ